MSIPKSNECQSPSNDGLLPFQEFHFAERGKRETNGATAASVDVAHNIGRANAYDDYKHFERIANETSLNSSFKDCGVEDVDFKGGLLSISPSPSFTSTTSYDSAKSDLSITTTPLLTSKGFANTFKLLETQVEDHIEKANTILDQLNVNLSLKSGVSCTEEKRNASDNNRLDLELEVIQRLVGLLPLDGVGGNLQREFEQIVCDKRAIAFVEMLYGFVAKVLSHDGDMQAKLDLLGLNENTSLRYHACKGLNGCERLKILRSLSDNQVLCGNRVSQMTRAYDDIEAVTRLLEEKEKDLELTVQIGKELLTQNNTLESRISDLEADLKTVTDERAQLMHELQKKNELITVLTDDADDGSKTTTPTFCKSITLDLLQKKITTLQDENKSLKMEVCQLADETTVVEEHERQLMEDITSQLSSASKQCDNLNLELERQREENRLQHEQIIFLTARLSETEMRLHQLTHDNEEHVTLLNITKENQNSLAQELIEFKQRYQEVLALLQETQEQLRQQRKKTMPHVRGGIMSSMGMLAPDSLQSELMESSLYSENSLDSGISSDIARVNDRLGRLMSSQVHGVYGGVAAAAGSAYNASGMLPPYKRVFETVRCANQNDTSLARLGTTPTLHSSSGLRMSSMAMGSSMGGKTLSCESLTSQSDDGYPSQTTGVPGAPGAKDLEAALKRLTPAEVLARRAMLSYGPAGTYSYDDQPQAPLPMGMRTPDSIMSTGSSGVSSTHMSSSLNQWRLPDKLQIVKPMEGSLTLHHWSRLATPTLSGLLEERPGVKIRGGRGLDELGMQIYSLSDVEEDVHDELPGKQFEPTGHIYTYTTSTIMHPDDGLVNDSSFLSQSQMSSRMASTSTSRQPSCPPTPRGLSRKNSCSTFSVNLGLASMLNERGIKAVTPSALNTPAGPNFTPTVTPCNSPEGSPTRSMSPEPFLGGILSSGADLIRRKLIGVDMERQKQKIKLSRLERRALRSLKLVEKVESIGLENIIAAQPSTMNQLASGIASRSASPMAQLTSLKNIHTNSNRSVDDISFDRNQIKGVLHKGLKAKGASPMSSACTSIYGSDTDEEIPQSLINKISDPTTKPPIKEERTAQKCIAEGTTLPSAGGAISTQNARAKQMQRQKSRRNLKNGVAMRPDLGTIGGGRVRSDLGQVSTGAARGSMDIGSSGVDRSEADAAKESQSLTQTVVGSISSLLFGRKGGWL